MDVQKKELELKIEKLEQEINFKNGLISILSHDSKEIFGNFVWLVEAVEQKTISEEDFFKLLPQVKIDAQKNLQTVQDSTAWLKTQYGNFEVKIAKINLFDIFQRVKEKYAIKLKEKELNFYFEGESDTFITTDLILLEFILDKLVNNAIKYSLPGQDIHFKYFTENSQDIISLTDTGTGISEKYLASIYNYDNPVFMGTAGEKGVGLSLKIVKNFVSLLHGNMSIKSSENEGTTVSVFLPKYKE